MPDIPNRDDLEADLVKRIMRVFVMTRKEIVALLGTPPDFTKIPVAFWDKISGELAASVMPFLTEVYMDATERLVAKLPVGVDWGLVNDRAATWAHDYSGALIRGVTDTGKRAVQDAVSDFFRQGMTRGDLEARLVRIYGPVRAEAIAITEVTRSASEGERQIMRELKEMGIDMIPVWQTRRDELVCPLCGPLHNKPILDDIYPPRHPRCRCFFNLELPKA